MFGNNSKLCFAICFGVLVVAVIMAAWGLPKIVNSQVQKSVQLENSSMMFAKWQKMPMPLMFKVYVFNITNPEEVAKGQKPKLAEVGPYTYKEYREKTITGYGPNDTIRYNLTKRFFFDQEASGSLTQDDELTVIHFSYLAAVLTIHDLMPNIVHSFNPGFDEFFGHPESPFMKVKIRDLFFNGIYHNCNGTTPSLTLMCAQLRGERQPTMRPSEDGNGFYFAMFAHLNNSEIGPYEVRRGRENVYDLGRIVSFRDLPSTGKWGNKYCDMINGTDGTIFPPIDENNVPDKLYTFEPDVCRSLYASLVDKRTLFNISAYYYEITESTLAAKSANPNNRCFCKKNWSANHDGCLLMGLLNLMPCQGAPVIASLPHFYLGSEELLEYFDEGIMPDKEKHGIYLYIDPITGVVLKGVQKLQFNIELRRIAKMPLLENVPTGLFPLLWLSEGAEITEDIKEELLHSHSLLSYVEIFRWAFLVLSLLATIVSGAIVARSNALCPRHVTSVDFVRPGNTQFK